MKVNMQTKSHQGLGGSGGTKHRQMPAILKTAIIHSQSAESMLSDKVWEMQTCPKERCETAETLIVKHRPGTEDYAYFISHK